MTRRERRPQRIGRRLARQLVEDRHSGSGAEELRELLELAAPSTVTRADTARLGALLAAYREAAESTPSPRAAYRRRSVPRSLTVRTAAVLLVVSGAGVGAAGAGILPAPIQRAAHDLFGAGHAPA
ncbi:MAG: hypothetical protein ACRDVE_17815, partial [Actinocrinis sp.]